MPGTAEPQAGLELQAHAGRLADLLHSARRVVFFGGAGVSTESGIPDFRSAGGVFRQDLPGGLSPEELVSIDCLEQQPELFFKFYREKMIFPAARPNAAHLALARLEQDGRLCAVVTQNIDGLHQMAGSRIVFELHGSIWRNYCAGCKARYDLEWLLQAAAVPHCPACGALVRPDVVLYGEMLDDEIWQNALRAIRQADLLIVGGTSLAVYPAAGLIRAFQGDNLVLINRTPTAYDDNAGCIIREPIGAVLGQAVNLLFNRLP
ncbi:MAG: NAD-dependent protein deacylase [Clostridiaceae bacterium]|nr:NAD-dependent protein deacylase [Clostridiaceae bacterium]